MTSALEKDGKYSHMCFFPWKDSAGRSPFLLQVICFSTSVICSSEKSTCCIRAQKVKLSFHRFLKKHMLRMLEYQNYILENFSHGLMNDGSSPVAHISFRRLVRRPFRCFYKGCFARTVSVPGWQPPFPLATFAFHIDQCMEAVAEGLAQIVHCDNWLFSSSLTSVLVNSLLQISFSICFLPSSTV